MTSGQPSHTHTQMVRNFIWDINEDVKPLHLHWETAAKVHKGTFFVELQKKRYRASSLHLFGPISHDIDRHDPRTFGFRRIGRGER
jgi:hypothetical protein